MQIVEALKKRVIAPERKLDIAEFNETAFDPGTTVRDLLKSVETDSDESLAMDYYYENQTSFGSRTSFH